MYLCVRYKYFDKISEKQSLAKKLNWKDDLARARISVKINQEMMLHCLSTSVDSEGLDLTHCPIICPIICPMA